MPEGELGILHLGGALNERDSDDGAVGNRDARYAIGIKGMWEPREPDADRFQQWVRAAWGRVRPFSTGATYVNFQTADEDDDRIRATYGTNFDRLLELKRTYDPDNLFRTNRNLREVPARGRAPARRGLRDEMLHGIPVSDRRLDLAGIPTAVLEGGHGAPMVLLHSSGEFAGLWRRAIPELVRTHRVIAPDLPGHGASGVPDGALGVDRTVAWLGALIDRTCAAPPVLVGRGLGGAIAARYAVTHSDRLDRLVLVGAFGLAPFEPAPSFAVALDHFMAQPTPHTRDALFEQCFVDLHHLRREMGRRWEPIAGYALERVSTSTVRASAAALMRYFGLSAIPEEELDRIAVQTSLIWGRNDLSVDVGVGEAGSGRHGWPLYIVDDAADDPPLERPSAFLTALAAALGT
jgi:pimeloyl-ACP methyl ester carboxylesterase